MRCVVELDGFRGDQESRGFATPISPTALSLADSAGGLHRFAIGDNALPAAATPSWYAANSVRGLFLLADGKGGYVLDAAGRMNPFQVGDNPMPVSIFTPDMWPADLARGVATVTDGVVPA